MFKIKTEYNWLEEEFKDILEQYFAVHPAPLNGEIEYTTEQGLIIDGKPIPTPISLSKFMSYFSVENDYFCDGFVLHVNTRTFEKDELIIKLTESETLLLELLIIYKTKDLSKEIMLDTLGWHQESNTHTLESHLSSLRQKLLPYFDIINTEQGYILQSNGFTV